MPIDVQWLDDVHTIIQLHYDADWVWDELFALQKQLTEKSDNPATQNRILHFIVVIETSYLPPNTLLNMRKLSQMRIPATGKTVVVNASALMIAFIASLTRLSNKIAQTVVFVDTIAEARSLLGLPFDNDLGVIVQDTALPQDNL
ncbi:MAG: hypothetical protein H7Y11_01825 [Armatimonadetes bacterium]|nr:hypothetical protein [Anaerolineae bacterium]